MLSFNKLEVEKSREWIIRMWWDNKYAKRVRIGTWDVKKLYRYKFKRWNGRYLKERDIEEIIIKIEIIIIIIKIEYIKEEEVIKWR